MVEIIANETFLRMVGLMKRTNSTAPSPQLEDDGELIRKFLAGDPESFAAIIQKYQHTVFGLCCRMLEDREDALDAAQDVFLKVFRSLGGFHHDSAFSTWLYRITVNTCKNKLASAAYRSRLRELREPEAEMGEDRRPEFSDERYAPEPAYERKITVIAVRQAIKALPPDQKILVVLYDIEGKSYEEIAQITKLKLGTVKSKLARARQRLRGWLEGVGAHEM